MKPMTHGLAGLCALGLLAAPAAAQNLMISSALPQVHFWTGVSMDGFADAMEAETDLSFTRFYGGELTAIGRELDALQAGAADVVSPLLAPYIAGAFPLTDITQLPVYGTDSPAITRAFQKLLDSDEVLKDGKTFYQYEIEPKGIRVWALGASAAYAISTTGRSIDAPADFQGLPIRAGAALQTMTLENLGVNPVTMPAAQAYEALSRRTLEGILLSVGDWRSYSLEDMLTFTIDGVALGHWESYKAISDASWDRLDADQQAAFDRNARATALATADYIENQEREVRELASSKGARFIDIAEMSPEMQAHIADASLATWRQWIERTEAAGHPARAAAVIWARLVQEEGGELPAGVAAYLAD